MALINCPECGKEISDTSKTCIHCGYILYKEESLRNRTKIIFNIAKVFDTVKKIEKKKLIGIGATIVSVFICFLCFNLFGGGPIESEASKYIRETKKIDNVKEINAVICISKKYYGHDENTLGYVILYSTKNESEFAYFEDGVYKGNGYNGGDANTSDNRSFYNIHALSAITKALEFIDNEGLTDTSCEKHFEADEGVVYIDLDDIGQWIENK